MTGRGSIWGVVLCLLGPAATAMAQEGDEPELIPPRLVEFIEAEYPAEARDEGREAAVELQIFIMADGSVMRVRVVGPAGHGFDEAAVAAAQRFVFEPARRGDEAVPARIRYRYVFELREEAPPEEGQPEGEVADGRLVGRVFDRRSEEALAGAEVVASNEDGSVARRAVTGEDGRFRFANLPPDTYGVRVYADEHADFEASEEVVSGESTEVTYRLDGLGDDQEFGAVAVVDAPPREAVRRTITREELTRVPGTRGDALRTVELLPGVGRPPFGSGQLIVRGSAPTDSQVFLDSTPVPLLYHFGGLTSFYHSRMLERIDFYPGNFSARFGRKIGGVLDVEARDPATDGPHAIADINIIDASLLVEAPLSDEFAIAIAARRSYIDFFFENLVPEDAFDVVAAPVYYDYQVVAAWHPSARDRFRFSIYGSSDEFRLVFSEPLDGDAAIRGGFDLATEFHKAVARWTRRLSPDVDQELQVAAGPGLFEFKLGEELFFDATFWTIDIRSEWRARLSSRVTAIAGMDISVIPFELLFRGPPVQQQEGNPNMADTLSQMEISQFDIEDVAYRPAAYLETDIRLADPLQLILGLRLDWYREIKQWSFDPRLVAIYSLDDENRLKVGAGIFSQPPEFPESHPDLGNPNLLPLRSVHLGLGYERDLAQGVSVGSEVFYKHIWDRVVGTDGALGERFNNDGIGRIYGLELSGRVQPDERRWFGFLSYTLSRSERRDHPDEPWRLFDFDQSHILSVAAVYRLGSGWEAGATFRLVSGNPQTPVLAPGIHDSLETDSYLPRYGMVNSDRAGFFHRLDLRVEKLWTFEHWKLALYLDVQNVYNEQSPEGTIYNYDFTDSTELPGLPVIPSLGLRGEL